MSEAYSLICEEIFFEGEKTRVFGIEAKSETNIQIHSISTDKQAVEQLVKKCNELSLSSLHILDVCEDFLVSNY